MFDILLKNGLIADGSGKAAFRGNIGVKDGNIVQIAPDLSGPAGRIIDCTGLVVAPGFIDCHSHNDYAAFRSLGGKTAEFDSAEGWFALEQGVTTLVCGHCGSSPAPFYDGAMRAKRQLLPPEEFARWVDASKTPKRFMETAEQSRTGVNMAYFLGHCSIRGSVMGFRDGKPAPEELSKMQEIVREAMEAGYLGYSTGLVYAPSVYGDADEFIALAKAMAPYGGVYASHIRGEGDNLERAVAEAIRVGEEGGVAVQLSHLKVMGLHNEGKSGAVLRMMEEANARGVAVTADQYPYNAGSAPLSSQIPPRFLVGGISALLERLKKPEVRREILYSACHEADVFESCIYSAGFDNTLISGAVKTPHYVNRTIGEIARDEGREPIDVLCDILIQNDGVAQGIYFNQSTVDLMRIMAHPLVFGGSDSTNPMGKRPDENTRGGRHPRGLGTMVRRLELTRDFRLRSLEESVRSLTAAPAEALHLAGQGLLQKGRAANITVFDYENLHAAASYTYPCRKNTGIEYVLVNGQLALEHGTATGVMAGRLVKRG